MRQKTYSDIKPEKKFDIENIENGKCTVLFFDNIEEENQEIFNLDTEEPVEKVIYNYDLYELEVTYRENLAEEIEKNIDEWLGVAKEKNYNEVASIVRKKRDELLSETDWTQMADTSLSEEKKEEYKEYRQLLRDVPQQEGFPYEIEWPSKENL